jgi:hypothetical protein
VHLRTGDLDLREPDPGLITVEEVAWGLSRTCRYSGKTPKHYSVGEHSVLVTQHLREQGEPGEVQLAAVLHDAHEALVGDVLPCVKALVVGYRRIEKDLDAASKRRRHDLPRVATGRAAAHVPAAQACSRAVLSGCTPKLRRVTPAERAARSLLGTCCPTACLARKAIAG